MYQKYQCPSCKSNIDEAIRMRVEIVNKKSRKVIERAYGEILCYACFNSRYHGRTVIRVYV